VHSGHGVRSSPETSQSDTRTDPLLHPSLGALHADTTIGRDRCTTPLQGGTDQAQVQAQAQAARRACWCGAVLCPALLGSAIDPKASPGPGPGQASAVALEIDSIRIIRRGLWRRGAAHNTGHGYRALICIKPTDTISAHLPCSATPDTQLLIDYTVGSPEDYSSAEP
jgi:hypothetical protein